MSHWTEELFIESAQIYINELLLIDERGNEEIQEVLNLLSDKEIHPTTALDVGCGIGRHSRALGQHEIETVGVDISPMFLEEARIRAKKEDVQDFTNFRKLSMQSLHELDQYFDLIICMFNTIGYFDDAENVTVLQEMRNQLTDTGVCVFQLINKDDILKNWPGNLIYEQDDQMVVEQYEFDSYTSRLERTQDLFHSKSNEWKHIGRMEYDIRIYSIPELRRALQKAGFNDICIRRSNDQLAIESKDPSRTAHERSQIIVVAS